MFVLCACRFVPLTPAPKSHAYSGSLEMVIVAEATTLLLERVTCLPTTSPTPQFRISYWKLFCSMLVCDKTVAFPFIHGLFLLISCLLCLKIHFTGHFKCLPTNKFIENGLSLIVPSNQMWTVKTKY